MALLTRRKIITIFFIFIFINLIVQYVNWRFNYWQIKDRASMVLDVVLGDEQHIEAERRISAMNYDYSKRSTIDSVVKVRSDFETLRTQTHYRSNTENDISDKSWAWITAISTENYVDPTVTMGHTLNVFSCVKKKLVLIDTKTVSKSGQEKLQKVGFELIPIDTLDCEMIETKYQVDVGEGEIPGTHNRYYCWNQTQYSKLIYVDPDVLVLSNIDELFTTNSTFSAAMCSPPRAKDNWCFNAGLLVITPSSQIFNEIVQSWIDTVLKEMRCLDDQNFLFYFYTQKYGWEKLPFLYNVRWVIHYPMKVFHFAGVGKPWKRDSRTGTNGVVLTGDDMHELWWYYYRQALTAYGL